MKIILITLLGLLINSTAFAKCGEGSFSIFPSGKTLAPNSILVLSGTGTKKDLIKLLGTKYFLSLKSGNKKIKLVVNHIYIGQHMIAQAIMKPETQLEPGKEYALVFDNYLPIDTLSVYNNSIGEDEKVVYKVTAEKDTKTPVVISEPKQIKKTFKVMGCGPSYYVIFDYKASDNSELLVKTLVKNLKTQKVVTYYLEGKDNKINIGTGMCSGAFLFDQKTTYEVEFSFMDASGNIAVMKDNRYKFTSPDPNLDDVDVNNE